MKREHSAKIKKHEAAIEKHKSAIAHVKKTAHKSAVKKSEKPKVSEKKYGKKEK